VVGLESRDGLPGVTSEDPVDRAIVVAVALQLGLHIHHHPVGRQIVVSIDWAVIRVIIPRVVTPCWIPVTRVPEIPPTSEKGKAIVMTSPPVLVVPLPVIIAERGILIAIEALTPPVVGDGDIAGTLDVKVLSLLGVEIRAAIDGHVIVSTNLLRVFHRGIAHALIAIRVHLVFMHDRTRVALGRHVMVLLVNLRGVDVVLTRFDLPGVVDRSIGRLRGRLG